MTSIPTEYLNQIVTGDARELAKRIPDDSIDLIFTDPPYPREFLPLYGWLAETAARVLKYNGLLLTLCGHYQVPDVIKQFDNILDFFWIGGMLHQTGQVARIIARNIMVGWKPILWFSKGKPFDSKKHWCFDLFQPTGGDKRYHEWGQDFKYAFYYIDKLTDEGEIIFDPFCGGGNACEAAIIARRDYIAFEIDPDVAECARERVRNTQPPLFVLQPEQAAMEFIT